jgi:hypothetical protein
MKFYDTITLKISQKVGAFFICGLIESVVINLKVMLGFSHFLDKLNNFYDYGTAMEEKDILKNLFFIKVYTYIP